MMTRQNWRMASGLVAPAPLTDTELRGLAPSVFAERPSSKVSDRYAFVPTIKIVDGLRSEGFLPVSARQSMVRLEGKENFSKHLLRFRRNGDSIPSKIGDLFPEVVLINSHDGSTRYRLSFGVFRLICMNGMVVADLGLGDIRVKHTGDIVAEVVRASFEMTKGFPLLRSKVDQMQQIELTTEDQNVFAEAALAVRYPAKPEEKVHRPVSVAQVLNPRRKDDNGTDLWTTFQRIQENTVRGGLLGRDARGGLRRTREIRGIDQNVTLNRALWTIAEYFRAVKLGEDPQEIVDPSEPIQ